MIGIPTCCEMVDHRLQLGGLAALRDEHRDVALGGHAEVAVDRFREMEEGRGRAGRSEGRGDLAPDVARFAEAADDQLALAVEDQRDRVLELLAEAVGERVERPRLVVEHLASELEHHCRVAGHARALASRAAAVKLDARPRQRLGSRPNRGERMAQETDPVHPVRAGARHHRRLGDQCRDRRRHARERRAAEVDRRLSQHRHRAVPAPDQDDHRAAGLLDAGRGHRAHGRRRRARPRRPALARLVHPAPAWSR